MCDVDGQLALEHDNVRRRPLVAALALAACAAAAAAQTTTPQADPAPAGIPVLILSTNLKVAQGRLTSLDFQNGATIIEASGKTQRFEPARTLALVAADAACDPLMGIGAFAPAAQRAAPDASLLTRALLARRGGLLVTTTGERLTGKLRIVDVTKDHLAWSSPRLGVFEVPLESVSSVRIALTDTDGSDAVPLDPAATPPAPPLPPPSADDAVVLFNGDTVRGLVTRIDSAVGIEGEEAEGKERTFEAARVAGVVLGNPVKPLTGQTLWLADGTVLSLKAASMERTPRGLSVRFESHAGAKGVVPLAEVRAWSPAPEKFTPLSSLPISDVKPLPGRVHAPTPSPTAHADDLAMPGTAALGASDLVLVGGVEATIALPKGARRLLATVALDEDAGEWGDCELVLTAGSLPPVSVRLSEETPAAELNTPLAGSTLTLRVEAGRFGTVKDRVRIMRALVLTAE